MTEQRFFLKHIDPQAGRVVFPQDIAHQIRHVLRLQPGDQVTVLDGGGKAYQVQMDPFEGDKITASVLRIGENIIGLPVHISLFFPMTKREKVEWILQKGTEVGVSVFQPFTSDRSLVQETVLPQKKVDRWEAIIREAAEQSGRAILPLLHQPSELSRIISSDLSGFSLDTVLVAALEENTRSLASQLNLKVGGLAAPKIGLFIGAEGGFSDQEIAAFQESQIPMVSLGLTVLRMETAAVVFPALVMYHLTR